MRISMLSQFRRRIMVVWACPVALQTSELVYKIWNTDIIKGRPQCLRKGIPNIDKKSKSLLMHHFQNRIKFLNTIIQNKEEVKHSKMKYISIVDTSKWVNLRNGISRAIDLMSFKPFQAFKGWGRTLRSNKSVTDNKINFPANRDTQILLPQSACMVCDNNQTLIAM